MSVKQAGLLARDMRRGRPVRDFQTWAGRPVGSGRKRLGTLGRRRRPHLFFFPERPLDRARFLADVKPATKSTLVRIVCGEGVCYADGTPVSASVTTTNSRRGDSAPWAGPARDDATHDGDALGCAASSRSASRWRCAPPIGPADGLGGSAGLRATGGRVGRARDFGSHGEHRPRVELAVSMVALHQPLPKWRSTPSDA